MCQLCKTKGGEMQSCQDCGRLICFDNRSDGTDVMDTAYVTNSGDLFCQRCGSKYDDAEEDERESDYYEPPFDDPYDDPYEAAE